MEDLRKIILSLTFVSFISSMINISWATDLDGVWIGHELTIEGMSGEISMTYLDSNFTFTSELYEEYVSGYYIDHPEVGTYNIEMFIEEYIIGDTTNSSYIGLSSLCIYEILFASESLEDWDDTLTIACNEPGSEEWPFTLNPEDSGSTARIFWLIRSNCPVDCSSFESQSVCEYYSECIWAEDYCYSPFASNEEGCTDPAACNYDPCADTDDGSCAYLEFYYYDMDCDGWGGVNSDWFCLEEGTQPNYCLSFIGGDFDDDCSCLFNTPEECYYECGDSLVCWGGLGDPPCEILGCTYEEATNYNPEATDDDGSCEYLWGDMNHDGTLNVQDVIFLVNAILSGNWL